MNESWRSIVALQPESLRGVVPAAITGKRPEFAWVDPTTIFVEEDYQRAILENGTALIRKIYAGFSWSRFKPPICVRVAESDDLLVCIDGQHTATACATHPGIGEIPVMIVDAASVAERAAAFVGHNKDRLALTSVMIYAAELAAGDALAVMIDRACKAAGAKIPRKAIWTGVGNKHPIGITASIGTVKAIAKRQGEEALTRVLKILVDAERGPIKSVEIAAAALICSLHPASIDKRLARIIARATAEEWTAMGQVQSVAVGKPLAVAVAALWCQKLDVSAPDTALKGNNTDHARLIAPKTELKPIVAQPTPRVAQPPRQIPAPPRQAATPVRQAAAPVRKPEAPARKSEAEVRKPSVIVDVMNDKVTHRGRTISLAGELCNGTMIVAALAREPKGLNFTHLSKRGFGSAGPEVERVMEIVEKINPVLAGAALEIRRMGDVCALADLG